DRLHHHRGGADAEAGAAVLLRHGDAEPAIARAGLLELPREFAVAVVRQPIVVAKALAELRNRFADALLLGREAKVHSDHHAFLAQLGNLAIVEAELHENLARMLAEL